MASLRVTILSIRYLSELLSALQSDVVITLGFRKPAIYTPVVCSILPEKAVAAQNAKTLFNPPLLVVRAISWLRTAMTKTKRLLRTISPAEMPDAMGRVAIVAAGGEVWTTTTRERSNRRLLAMAA